MPSLKLELPEHVVAKPRKGGTFRVFYNVQRNRPASWAPTIPLPRVGPRTGNLQNIDELARIVNDAKALSVLLAQARLGGVGMPPPPGSLPAVAALWKKSDHWNLHMEPRTQNYYRKNIDVLEDWSTSIKHPQFGDLDLPTILAYLKTYADRPAQQRNLKATLSVLFSFAREEGIVKAHPFNARVTVRKQKKAKRTVDLWTADDVKQYREAAARTWAGGALLVWLMWETSADSTDVVTWRKGEGGNFRDTAQPAIIFKRGKTKDRQGTIPISHELAAAIRANGSIFFVTDPDGVPYPLAGSVEAEALVKADNRRGKSYDKVRAVVVKEGGRRLLLDQLRHSAATHAVDCGASVTDTTALTLHKDEKMLETIYVQLTEAQALKVQRARGIIQ